MRRYSGPKSVYDTYTPQEVKRASPLQPANIPGKPEYYSTATGIPHFRNLAHITDTDPDFFYRINAVYLGRITYTDWLFDLLLDALESTRHIDNTAVFVASDHGDFAGDYHLVEKWPGGLDDVLTRIPLIASIPGGAHNHVVAEPVALFDIMATILDLAHVATDDIHFSVSLLHQLKGSRGDAARTVYAEGGFYYDDELEPNDPLEEKTYSDPKNMYYPRGRQEMQPNGVPRCVMARTVDYKLVYRPLGTSELYILANDTHETHNVYGQHTYNAIQQDMMKNLLNWFVLTSDVPSNEESNVRDLPPNNPPPTTPPLEPATDDPFARPVPFK